MQEKINFLTIQYPYEFIEIGLYQNSICIARIQEHKFKASMALIPMIDSLLKKNTLSLQQISYIAVNIGPGPYNTLRAIIATANAIAVAQHIPLVGCDSLTLLHTYYKHEKYQTIALLKAFSGHIYFQHNETQGYASITQLPEYLIIDKNYYFVGNAGIAYEQDLKKLFPSAIIDSVILFPELDICARHSIKLFGQGKTSTQLQPLYLHQSLS